MANGAVTAGNAQKLIASNKALIILDVRTQSEYDAGHLKNALLIDYRKSDFEMKLSELKRTRPYLIYCARGRRSSSTLALMDSLGFTSVYNMIGGYNAWVSQGRPTITKVKP